MLRRHVSPRPPNPAGPLLRAPELRPCPMMSRKSSRGRRTCGSRFGTSGEKSSSRQMRRSLNLPNWGSGPCSSPVSPQPPTHRDLMSRWRAGRRCSTSAVCGLLPLHRGRPNARRRGVGAPHHYSPGPSRRHRTHRRSRRILLPPAHGLPAQRNRATPIPAKHRPTRSEEAPPDAGPQACGPGRQDRPPRVRKPRAPAPPSRDRNSRSRRPNTNRRRSALRLPPDPK